jgi:hypothetical protein
MIETTGHQCQEQGQDSQDRIQDSRDKKARTGQLERQFRKYIQNGKERTGRQNMTARTEQLKKEKRDGTTMEGQLG